MQLSPCNCLTKLKNILSFLFIISLALTVSFISGGGVPTAFHRKFFHIIEIKNE